MKTFDRPYAEILYHESLHAVEIKWKGFASVENYKETLDSAFNIIVAKRCSHWISDMIQGKAVPAEATEWLQKEYIPKVLHKGIKKVAFLVDHNALRALYARSIKGSIENHNIPLRHFSDRKELEQWLGVDNQTSTKVVTPSKSLLAEV